MKALPIIKHHTGEEMEHLARNCKYAHWVCRSPRLPVPRVSVFRPCVIGFMFTTCGVLGDYVLFHAGVVSAGCRRRLSR